MSPAQTWVHRIAGKAYSLIRGWRRSDSYAACAEMRAWMQVRFSEVPLVHCLYLEEHAPWLAPMARRVPLVGTIHQPFSWWEANRDFRGLPLSHALLLFRRDVTRFQEALGVPTEFIPYGVDTSFFTPAEPGSPGPQPYLLSVGHHLRDIPMLVRVLQRLSAKGRAPKLVMVMSRAAADRLDLEALNRVADLSLRTGLSDEALRDLYRGASLLLMPMQDVGASNAVVEALACGLPIVSTDVGGMADYGGGEVFPVAAPDDDEAMAALVERYLEDPGWRDRTGRDCRRFAEQHLAWPIVAGRHREVYNGVLARTRP